MSDEHVDLFQGIGALVSVVGLVMLLAGIFQDTVTGLRLEVFGSALFLGGLLIICSGAVVEAIKKRP